MVEIVEFVLCPIKMSEIDIGEYEDIQNVVDNMVIESVIDFTLTEEDKIRCKNCKKRIYPSL